MKRGCCCFFNKKHVRSKLKCAILEVPGRVWDERNGVGLNFSGFFLGVAD